MKSSQTESVSDDMAIDLPLVKLEKEDVYGALFVHTDNMDELYQDALRKLQIWIMNYAEEMVKPLRECGEFSEDEIEAIRKKSCVISPITLTLYLHWLQIESFSKMTDSEKERYLLEKIPDRFKARFKGNAACRNAREVPPEEEASNAESESEEEVLERKRKESFEEFVKEFGEEVRKGKA